LKNYRWPIFENEKLAPESIVYNRMSRDNHKVVLINKVLLVYEYRSDGYSLNILKVRKNSPTGYFLFNYENVIAPDFELTKYYLKSIANIIALQILSSAKPYKVFLGVLIALPIGLIKGMIDRYKLSK
jgi:hypothetical protein